MVIVITKKDPKVRIKCEKLPKKTEECHQNCSIAVDVLVFSISSHEAMNYRKLPEKRLSVLMTKEDGHESWQLPRTLKRIGENLEQAAYRKALDAIGQDNFYMEQLYSFSDSYNQSEVLANISYLVLTPEINLCSQSDCNYSTYKWFEVTINSTLENDTQWTVDQLKSGKYEHFTNVISLEALDDSSVKTMDSRILMCGIERLRNKIEYTDIIFHLMPKTFTLTELQQVQELILDDKLYTAHFRRKIEQKLIKSPNQVSVAKGHRPAQQYCYNISWKDKERRGRV